MKFLKTFLASLLAFVVGGLVVFFLSMIILMGVIGSITSKEQVVIGNHAILKIDMAEDITDSPSTTPFGNIDLATMTATYQISLMNALRAIETAKEDPRIQGIYLRMNGSGVTSLSILEELREALKALKGPLSNVPNFRKKLQDLVNDEKTRDALLQELGIDAEEDK